MTEIFIDYLAEIYFIFYLIDKNLLKKDLLKYF